MASVKDFKSERRCNHISEMVYQAGDRIEKNLPSLRQMDNGCKESLIDVKLLQKTSVNEQQTEKS
jgi:hypothetical protein